MFARTPSMYAMGFSATMATAAMMGLGGCSASASVDAKTPQAQKTKQTKPKGKAEESQQQAAPPKPAVDEQDEALRAQCTFLSDRFSKGAFHISGLSTVEEGQGYLLRLYIEEIKKSGGEEKPIAIPIDINPVKEMGGGNNYSFVEGHKLSSMEIGAVEEGCLDWTLDKKSNERLVREVNAFIEMYVKEFLALRDNAKVINVAKLPYNNPILKTVVMMFDTPGIADQLSKEPVYEKRLKGKLGRDIRRFKQAFPNVGLEYVTGANKQTFIAIYSNMKDKAEGKPPAFFAVDMGGGAAAPFIFIHNFNEDRGTHYLDPKAGSQKSSALAASGGDLHKQCDERMLSKQKQKMCKAIVDFCTAASAASAKITLNIHAGSRPVGSIDFDNAEQCIESAFFFAGWGFSIQ